MFLSLLTKDEKYAYLDLLNMLLTTNGNMSEEGRKIFNRHRYETGEEGYRYRKSSQTAENLVKLFASKTEFVKKVVFMNLTGASYEYEYYSVEEHEFIDNIRKEFGITDKKQKEIQKVIYAEKDVKEKAKRLISE